MLPTGASLIPRSLSTGMRRSERIRSRMPLLIPRLTRYEIGAMNGKELAMSNYGVISAILNHKGHQVWSISQDATAFDAIKMMADKNVGALLVMDGTTPIGIVSERDYARKVDLKGNSSREVRVGTIISKKLITATSKNTVEECMRLMSSHRVRHLPVMEEGRVMGIVSIGDLVNWIIHAQTETIIQLESYITGHYPE